MKTLPLILLIVSLSSCIERQDTSPLLDMSASSDMAASPDMAKSPDMPAEADMLATIDMVATSDMPSPPKDDDMSSIPAEPECETAKDCRGDFNLSDPMTAECLVHPVSRVNECANCHQDSDCPDGQTCVGHRKCVE